MLKRNGEQKEKRGEGSQKIEEREREGDGETHLVWHRGISPREDHKGPHDVADSKH